MYVEAQLMQSGESNNKSSLQTVATNKKKIWLCQPRRRCMLVATYVCTYICILVRHRCMFSLNNAKPNYGCDLWMVDWPTEYAKGGRPKEPKQGLVCPGSAYLVGSELQPSRCKANESESQLLNALVVASTAPTGRTRAFRKWLSLASEERT